MRGTQRAIFVTSWVLAGLFCQATLGATEMLSELRTVNLLFPPGERSIICLVIGPDEMLYGATARPAENAPGLFRYDPAGKEPPALMSSPKALPMRPAPVHAKAWMWDASWRCGYSLSATGMLHLHREDGSVKELGQVAGTRPHEPEGYQVSKALFTDVEGNVYTAGAAGVLYRYSPVEGKLKGLKAKLPAVRGREPWASLDAASPGPDGLIYGGSFDGYIFTFDPKTHEVVNLGKPLRQQRIQGLVFSGDKLYGVGGEEEGLPRAFAYDPQTSGFQLGGTLRVAAGDIIREPVGGLVADQEGRIYVGTTGRLGNLYVWRRGEE